MRICWEFRYHAFTAVFHPLLSGTDKEVASAQPCFGCERRLHIRSARIEIDPHQIAHFNVLLLDSDPAAIFSSDHFADLRCAGRDSGKILDRILRHHNQQPSAGLRIT